MALFNYATKEITLKVVYYGPGLSGKTTNLQYLHSVLNPATRGKLLSLSTEADRTLFFDFLPVELGKIRDFSIRFQLYTVPGQVRYNATRKIVLKGADAVVFVTDSQREMREQNVESLMNMRDNLYSNNINPDDIPIILQYNKRDLKNIASVDELDQDLNRHNYPVVESSAITGQGVEDSFNLITRLLLKHISKKHKIEIKPKEEVKTGEVPPAPENTQAAMLHLRQELGGAQSDIARSALKPDIPVEEPVARIPPPEGTEVPAVPTGQMDEVPLMATEKIDEVIATIKKINEAVEGVQRSLSLLTDKMRGIEQIKKEQETSNSILQEIAALLEGIKARKGMFKFW